MVELVVAMGEEGKAMEDGEMEEGVEAWEEMERAEEALVQVGQGWQVGRLATKEVAGRLEVGRSVGKGSKVRTG